MRLQANVDFEPAARGVRSLVRASSVTALTGALVHHSATARPHQRALHETFIAHKLAISFTALAVAPFFLAYRGAPTPAESLVFVFGLVPLAVAVVVAWTGRIDLGHAMQCAGLIGFALILLIGTSAGAGASIAWLIVAQWEARLSGNRRLTLVAQLTISATVAVVLMAVQHDLQPPILSSSLVLAGLALAYAVTLASITRPIEAVEPRGEAPFEHLARLTDALGDLIIEFDAGGWVDQVSGQTETILGVPDSELLGRGLFQIVHVADRPAFLKLIADAGDGNGTMTSTVRVRTRRAPDGVAEPPRFLWLEMRAHRTARGGEPSTRVMALLRDVTESRVHEQEVETAQRSVEISLRSKDDFLANMSHELRTPLNAIIGFSEMLGSHTLRPADPDKQREYALIIHQSGQHLLAVVNSILDMSKIQSGTFAFVSEPFDLSPLIEQCCDIVRLKAQEGRVRLSRDVPERLEEIVGDRRACKQILINLLSNAVKFTPEDGEVKVSAQPEGNAIVISVSDTGIGIGAEDMARLGDPFFQARSSLSRPFEGTGLGLSVVRGLLGLHGGTMTIESEPSKGTRVTVRLPIDCQAIANKSARATIETIPRRTAIPASARKAYEPRMKSIA